jgi:hypothetical protein
MAAQEVERDPVVAGRYQHLGITALECADDRHEILHLRRVLDVDPDSKSHD